MNLRDRRLIDVYEVNLETGALKLVAENPGDVVDWDATDDLEVKVALRPGSRTAAPRSASARAPPLRGRRCSPLPSARASGSSTSPPTARPCSSTSSLNANTTRVIRKEIATGTETVIAENPNVDAGEVMIHPVKHVVQAVDFPAGRQAWTVIDPLVKARLRGHLEAPRRRLPRREPRPRRQDLAGGLHRGPRPGPLLLLGPRDEEGHLPLRAPAQAGGAAARPDARRLLPGPRRPHPERLPDAPGGREAVQASRSCSSSTAARGPATPGATTRTRSGSPTAATPSCR